MVVTRIGPTTPGGSAQQLTEPDPRSTATPQINLTQSQFVDNRAGLNLTGTSDPTVINAGQQAQTQPSTGWTGPASGSSPGWDPGAGYTGPRTPDGKPDWAAMNPQAAADAQKRMQDSVDDLKQKLVAGGMDEDFASWYAWKLISKVSDELPKKLDAEKDPDVPESIKERIRERNSENSFAAELQTD